MAHQGAPIHRPVVTPTVKLTHDAGENKWCVVLDRGLGVRLVAHDLLSEDFRGTSSTHRELYGLLSGLQSFAEQLAGETIVVYGDNQSAVHNLEIGSKNPSLQRVCMEIFRLCMRGTT
jgi:hypothetical protein